MISAKIRKELKAKLQDEKTRLENELRRFAKPDSKLKGDFDTTAPDFGGSTQDRDMDADASETEEYEKLTAVEHALELRLKEVNAALATIDQPTYGICSKCRRPIAIERLRVNPAATTCLEC